MQNLVTLLTEQTQILKEEYLQKTEEWGVINYNRLIERVSWGVKEWCNFLGIAPRVVTEEFLSKNSRYRSYPIGGLLFPDNFHNSKYSKSYHNALDEVTRTSKQSLEDYLKKIKISAEYHYTDSILKLASRILKKDLDTSKIEVVTSRIDVNIESIITDGTKTVRAWTIVAEGEIQRPHYRYLIK